MKSTVETVYGKATVYRVPPKNGHASDQLWLVPGFSETLAHTQSVVDMAAEEGFDASTFSQPRGSGESIRADDGPLERQSRLFLDIIRAKVPPVEKIDAVGHSLGCATLLLAAQKEPWRFKSITLMQPVGMVGEQSLLEMAGRSAKKVASIQGGAIIKGQSPKRRFSKAHQAKFDSEGRLSYSGRILRAQNAAGKLLLSHPGLAIDEANAARRYDIQQDLEKVSQLGIPINIVTSKSDEFFDNDKVLPYESIADDISSYSMVAERKARHDTLWMQPRRTAKIIGSLLIKR